MGEEAADPASNSEEGQMEQSLQPILGKWVSNLRSSDPRKTGHTSTINYPPNAAAGQQSEEVAPFLTL